MVTVEDVRAVALDLPRTVKVLVRDRIKFRVGRIVYVGFSRDETLMGFAFPKLERAALVEAEPAKFTMPGPADERYNWVLARLAAIDVAEMRELVIDARSMVVPKGVARGTPSETAELNCFEDRRSKPSVRTRSKRPDPRSS